MRLCAMEIMSTKAKLFSLGKKITATKNYVCLDRVPDHVLVQKLWLNLSKLSCVPVISMSSNVHLWPNPLFYKWGFSVFIKTIFSESEWHFSFSLTDRFRPYSFWSCLVQCKSRSGQSWTDFRPQRGGGTKAGFFAGNVTPLSNTKTCPSTQWWNSAVIQTTAL